MATNKSDHLILIKRLLIIFGSICFLWFIIGLIFISIETYRHLKRKTNHKFFRCSPLALLTSIQQTFKDDHISENDDDDDDEEDDDQRSVFTSISFISNRSKPNHNQTYLPTSSDESLPFASPPGNSNLAYSSSTITSSSDLGSSFLYYPGCRNFAYSQSTLSSSIDDIHQITSTPSVTIPLINTLSTIRPSHYERQSSINTVSSQITNATYVSGRSLPKSIALPTVMITDVDRLQTDIIELEDFEPEKDWSQNRSQLRVLLNEHMPYEIKAYS